jgi:hypothetical protein
LFFPHESGAIVFCEHGRQVTGRRLDRQYWSSAHRAPHAPQFSG